MKTYRELFAIAGVPRLLLSATFPRLAYSMVGLAVFFHLQEMTGSVGTAGLALGVMSLMGSLTAAPRGAFVDRYGQSIPLYVMTPGYVLAASLMAKFATTTSSALFFAVLLGIAAPPINMSIRPLWVELVGKDRVRTAYGLDSAHMNLMQLLGPVIATIVALHISSAAGLYLVAGSMALGGLMLATNPNSKAWVPEERVVGEVGILRSPAMRLLALEGASMGFAMGFITIGIPALATLSGSREQAGPLMSAIGVGSIIGTVWAGAKAKNVSSGYRPAELGLALRNLPAAIGMGANWTVAHDAGGRRVRPHGASPGVLPGNHRHRATAGHRGGRARHAVDDRRQCRGDRQCTGRQYRGVGESTIDAAFGQHLRLHLTGSADHRHEDGVEGSGSSAVPYHFRSTRRLDRPTTRGLHPPSGEAQQSAQTAVGASRRVC